MIKKTQVFLVIPCYNEAKRINTLPFIQRAGQHLAFLMVNDGSQDNTLEILNEMAQQSPWIKVLDLKRNQGKAEAVRLGSLALPEIFSSFKNSEDQYFGFWDADLATPLEAVEWFFDYMFIFNKGPSLQQNLVDALWGSRIKKSGSVISRSYLRHYLARVFSTSIDIYLGIKAYDTQCGAKLFKTKHLEILFKEPFCSKWIFDVELFLKLERHGLKLLECPLYQWEDVKGSKINWKRDIFLILRDLYHIKKKYSLATHH